MIHPAQQSSMECKLSAVDATPENRDEILSAADVARMPSHVPKWRASDFECSRPMRPNEAT